MAIASLTVTLLIIGAGLGVTILSPFSKSADQIAVVGDVLAGGIFLLALAAAVVAVLAYEYSSRRPELAVQWHLQSPDGARLEDVLPRDNETTRTFAGVLPALWGDVANLVPLAPVKLHVRVTNSGQSAAQNVAVAFYLEGVFFSPPPGNPGSRWKCKCLSEYGWQVQWQGGLDRPVYPGTVGRTVTVDQHLGRHRNASLRVGRGGCRC